MNFYSRPCGRGDGAPLQASRPAGQFLLTPLREGRPDAALQTDREDWISTHAPAGGATDGKFHIPLTQQEFLLTPLREGRPRAGGRNDGNEDHFYSRPCGRGDFVGLQLVNVDHFISTHAPAGGATFAFSEEWDGLTKFLLTPLREGRPIAGRFFVNHASFLLTPLREGRPVCKPRKTRQGKISTHAPAGGATLSSFPLSAVLCRISTHAPAGGATDHPQILRPAGAISTHAPAGGATRRAL